MYNLIASPPLNLVAVRSGRLRSINVERDLAHSSVIQSYLVTPQARQALNRLLDGLRPEATTRAWTLTGPYGSGKSYFGLFLMNLLGPALPGHMAALQQLAEIDFPLAEKVQGLAAKGNGYLSIPVVGYRATMATALKVGVRQALAIFPEDSLIAALLHKLDTAALESRAFVRWLADLQNHLQNVHHYNGLLFVMDEMGKLLEYTATHSEAADIYLLQELAEWAARSATRPTLFVGILHQAFERYAGHLDSITQREWAKIQGRFEDIAFQEPPTQQMALLVNALLGSEVHGSELAPHLEAEAHRAVDSGWLPPLMKPSEFVALSRRAYPFHPTALVALPYLFRRLAQNERSIFAYLASFEPFGLQEFLQRNPASTLIYLSDLFDYLAANFEGRLYASFKERIITETLERLTHAGALEPEAIEALKTIGLLNWLAEIGPFRATETSLIAALRATEGAEHTHAMLQTLINRSLVVYRRFNQSYAIWQGSDVNIEEQLAEARQQLAGTFSVAEAVQEHLAPRPIIARRHSYQIGASRYFALRYADATIRDQVALEAESGASGLVLLCLSTTESEARELQTWATHPDRATRPDLVIGVTVQTWRLAELLGELRALHWVQEKTPELRDDPVARRELRARQNIVETLIRNELDQALTLSGLERGGGCTWFYRGEDVSDGTQRGITALLSAVADQIYPESPRIWNEILNRRVLTSQGAAARRNLLERMLEHGSKTTLGISGFPPERSMYESLLREGELHCQSEAGQWYFAAPSAADPLHLLPAWQALAGAIFDKSPEPRSVKELFDLLASPPFGITEGVLPILLCAFMLVHADETTLYQDGTLRPLPTVADWEVLQRRPELFSVGGSRVSGARLVVVERLARSLGATAATVPVMRELIRRLQSLPDHAWRTQALTPTTLGARRAIEQARSPESLLFFELPQALGVGSISEEVVDEEQVEHFFEKLNEALQELAQVMEKRLEWAREIFLEACGLPTDKADWQHFMALAGTMAPLATHPTLATLLRRVAETTNEQQALESALALIANRPARQWTDRDVEHFEKQARALG
ncbi:MAG: hypothetical protein H0T73_03205, partial [Ardenticatenales bacterium]|nr:hypothetical protein [Ardenticatenales bacterium]